MKDERNEQVGWVSLVVDESVCSHFAHFIASFSRLPKGSLAVFRSLTCFLRPTCWYCSLVAIARQASADSQHR